MLRLAPRRTPHAFLVFLGIGIGLATGLGADDAPPCFDFTTPVEEPLRPSIPLLGDRDNSAFGTYRSGIDWAAARALLKMPIGAVYAKLLDHRNVKDMKKTTLVTRVREEPHYLDFHEVDVVVRLRALFLKLTVKWTEAWAYRLVEGTKDAPRKVVVSYQKIAGTRHIVHQCGSYVLVAHDDASTDLSLYEEVQAKRRSAEDTRDMHAGILRTIRGSEELAAGGPFVQ